MDIMVIGSRELVAAFALGGMQGRVARGRRDLLDALEDVAAAGARIVAIEEGLAESARPEIEALKLDSRGPLLVEVPGFGGPAGERRTPLELVRQALGIRI